MLCFQYFNLSWNISFEDQMQMISIPPLRNVASFKWQRDQRKNLINVTLTTKFQAIHLLKYPQLDVYIPKTEGRRKEGEKTKMSK